MPADRDTILRLVQRDQAPTTPLGGLSQSMFSAANCELWPGKVPLLELRTWGSVRLPASVADHAWFGTAVKELAANTLADGPLPDQLWNMSTKKFRRHPWLMTDTRSTWFRLESEARPDLTHPNPVLTAAQAQIGAQDLQVLIAGALVAQDENSVEDLKQHPLPIELLHEALAATLYVHGSLCRSLAAALEVMEPLSWFPVSSQLMPGKYGTYDEPRLLDDVFDLKHWDRDTTNQLPSHVFPRAVSPRADLEAISALTLEWLNLFLLDVGARGFEADLERLSLPAYLKSL